MFASCCRPPGAVWCCCIVSLQPCLPMACANVLGFFPRVREMITHHPAVLRYHRAAHSDSAACFSHWPLTKAATELIVGVWLWPWVTCILICVLFWGFFSFLRSFLYNACFCCGCLIYIFNKQKQKKKFFEPDRLSVYSLKPLSAYKQHYLCPFAHAGRFLLVVVVVLLLLQRLLDVLRRLLVRVANTDDQITQPQLGAHCRKGKGTSAAKCAKWHHMKRRALHTFDIFKIH